MEENSENVRETQVPRDGEIMESPWVSPEVQAARAGEQVDFGKDLDENDPDKQDTDPDA